MLHHQVTSALLTAQQAVHGRLEPGIPCQLYDLGEEGGAVLIHGSAESVPEQTILTLQLGRVEVDLEARITGQAGRVCRFAFNLRQDRSLLRWLLTCIVDGTGLQPRGRESSRSGAHVWTFGSDGCEIGIEGEGPLDRPLLTSFHLSLNRSNDQIKLYFGPDGLRAEVDIHHRATDRLRNPFMLAGLAHLALTCGSQLPAAWYSDLVALIDQAVPAGQVSGLAHGLQSRDMAL